MKTCQACGIRPAEVEFIQASGEEKREMSLCRECALSIGVRAQVEAFQRLSKMLMQPQMITGAPEEMRAALSAKCENCGCVFEEFVNTGLLGCPECYKNFHEYLQPVLRRMHGTTKLASETESPAPPKEQTRESREQLEMELHLALLEEEYEKAAQIRDKLKKL